MDQCSNCLGQQVQGQDVSQQMIKPLDTITNIFSVKVHVLDHEQEGQQDKKQ